MAAGTGPQSTGGISRRSALRAGLLAGAGIATVGATSVVLTGTAQAGTAPNPQPDWGWCEFCSTMWWTPNSGYSVCANPNHATHAKRSGAYNYQLNNNISGLTNKTNPQANWQWCDFCQGLFWVQSSNSHCMGNSDGLWPHGTGSSTNYDIFFNLSSSATTDPQAFWRWCGQCALLYWQGSSGTQAGYCPIGGPHRAGSGTNYCVYWTGTY